MATRLNVQKRRDKVMKLAMNGMNDREIAEKLNANIKTIANDRYVVFSKVIDRSTKTLETTAGKFIAQLQGMVDTAYQRWKDGDEKEAKNFIAAADKLARYTGINDFLDNLATDADKDTWAQAITEMRENGNGNGNHH